MGRRCGRSWGAVDMHPSRVVHLRRQCVNYRCPRRPSPVRSADRHRSGHRRRRDAARVAALLVGADAANRSHPMERLTRDSQMLLHHVSVNTAAQERLGNVLLGSYAGPAGLI